MNFSHHSVEQNMNNKTIGDRIQEERVKRGVELKDLADKVGVTDSTIWYWENKECNPKPNNLHKLKETLDLEDGLFEKNGAPENRVLRQAKQVIEDVRDHMRYHDCQHYPPDDCCTACHVKREIEILDYLINEEQ